MCNKASHDHLKTFTQSARPFSFFTVLLLSVFVITPTTLAEHVITSPDGNVVITFDVKDTGNQTGRLTYSVDYDNQPIIVDAHLGLAIKDAAPLETGFDILNVSTSRHDSTYSPVYAERKTIRDHYNQLAAELKESHPPIAGFN